MPTMSSVSRVTSHVIFDVDGLLLDTESIYSDIMTRLCSTYGKEFTMEVKAQQMGRKTEIAGQILINAFQLPISVEEYTQYLHAQEEAMFPTSKLKPGVERLLQLLEDAGVGMCLATGSDCRALHLKTTLHRELFKRYFRHTVASGDDPEVVRGKPDPMIFEIALRRFGQESIPLNQVLVFEDSPIGVEAGLRAGMHVIWVPEAHTDLSLYADHPNVTTIDSLLNFQAENFGLPKLSE